MVVPSFNRKEMIGETLESVIANTSENWELLCVDDHSSDNSLEVVAAFTQEDSRVKYWSRKSSVGGAPACRNEGASKANGDYLIFLDSDDLLHCSCLKRRTEEFQKHPEMDFLVFPGDRFDCEPGDLGDRWFTQSDDSLNDFLEGPAWQTSAVIWKKSAFEKLGGFGEDLLSWQDWDLHVRAIASGLQFQLIDGDADYYVRRGHKSRISKQSEVKLSHLRQRSELFRDTITLLRETRNWNQRRQDLMVRRYVVLAIQMRNAGNPEESERVLESMQQEIILSDGKYRKIIEYFRFETNTFYRRSVVGRLVRPIIKQYHRSRLGACVIQRAK